MAVTRTASPIVWKNVLALLALGKVAVAGAGVGLAALGVVDVAHALGIRDLVNEITHNQALDWFGYGGGMIAVVGRLIWQVCLR
jgi:hypothetical protein